MRGESLREESLEVQEGLTWRSFLAIVYSGIVLQPFVWYLALAVGYVNTALIVPTTVILLFSELSYFFGKPIRKQELYIMWAASTVPCEIYMLTLLYNIWYRSSPISWMFTAPGSSTPLPFLIPDWFSPPLNSPVRQLRTLFYPDMILPIAVFFLGVYFLPTTLCAFSEGFILYEIYKEENLPFPLQVAQVEAVMTLSEREPARIRILTLCGLISMIYTLFLYAVPLISGFNVMPIPIPWFDFNLELEKYLPGASLGIATDLTLYAIGLMLPLSLTIFMFAGSFSLYFVGNHLLTSWGIFEEWRPGMSVALAFQRSTLHVWAGVIVGLAIAAGLMPLIKNPRYVTGAIRSATKLSKNGRAGIPPLWLVLIVYLTSATAIIIMTYFLVPSFPIWWSILLTAWTFLLALVSARGIGVAGQPITIPYVRESILIGSGYPNVDVWYSPIGSVNNAEWFVAFYKMAELTKTKPTSYVKANIIGTFIGLVMSLIYLNMFWSIAPVPSSAYPFTIIQWPVNAILQNLWITRSFSIFKLEYILGAFIVGSGLYFGFELLGVVGLRMPFSLLGIAAGASSALPVNMAILTSAIAGKAIERKLGREKWGQTRPTVVAGLLLGEGAMITVSAGIAMLLRARWILPY